MCSKDLLYIIAGNYAGESFYSDTRHLVSNLTSPASSDVPPLSHDVKYLTKFRTIPEKSQESMHRWDNDDYLEQKPFRRKISERSFSPEDRIYETYSCPIRSSSLDRGLMLRDEHFRPVLQTFKPVSERRNTPNITINSAPDVTTDSSKKQDCSEKQVSINNSPVKQIEGQSNLVEVKRSPPVKQKSCDYPCRKQVNIGHSLVKQQSCDHSPNVQVNSSYKPADQAHYAVEGGSWDGHNLSSNNSNAISEPSCLNSLHNNSNSIEGYHSGLPYISPADRCNAQNDCVVRGDHLYSKCDKKQERTLAALLDCPYSTSSPSPEREVHPFSICRNGNCSPSSSDNAPTHMRFEYFSTDELDYIADVDCTSVSLDARNAPVNIEGVGEVGENESTVAFINTNNAVLKTGPFPEKNNKKCWRTRRGRRRGQLMVS